LQIVWVFYCSRAIAPGPLTSRRTAPPPASTRRIPGVGDNAGMSRSFDELLSEAAAAPVDGWDFSWLDGRATEERPSWGYQRLMSQRLATVSAALDIDTGGGEVLSGAETFPPTMAATESWPPNAVLATRLLHPRGVVVVATRDEASLPFAGEAFDLVTSRHATVVRWHEIARVLRPGGGYLAQQIGPATMSELFEYFLGPQPYKWAELQPETQTTQAQAAGLQVVQMRMERLRVEFFDIGAVIYFLRKVIWTVPDFSVERYHERLREMHEQIEASGRFVAHSTRLLVEARKP
jgi:SAM-dependent methyltransferase